MFKPTHFRFQNSIHWPGAGPTTEVHAEHCAKVDSEGEHFTFVHAGGHAVKVPKSEVTAYGFYDADDVPNLPTEDDYKDDVTKLNDEEDSEDSEDKEKDEKEDDVGSEFKLDEDKEDEDKEDEDTSFDAPAEPQSSPSFPGTIGDITEDASFSNEQFSDSPLDKKNKKKKK